MRNFFIEGRKEMAEETFDWLFVDFIPLLYEKKRLARQSQIETWLDLAQVAKELGIEKTENRLSTTALASYVV
jgi:hypothetical protein